eukprot:8788374-Pyramimonas_sp.AAC.1
MTANCAKPTNRSALPPADECHPCVRPESMWRPSRSAHLHHHNPVGESNQRIKEARPEHGAICDGMGVSDDGMGVYGDGTGVYGDGMGVSGARLTNLTKPTILEQANDS